MGQHLTVSTGELDGFEGLYDAVKGSHVDVMQLERGKLRGTLSHVGIGDFSLSIGAFNVGVRTQRISTDPKLIIGMLLNATDRVTHWAFDMQPADVLVIPPSVEHDGVFHSASSYAAIRFDLSDLPDIFGGEPRLADAETWQAKNHFRADPTIGMGAADKLPRIVAHLARYPDALTDASADFWRRAIVDCVTATVVTSLPPDGTSYLPSAMRLVRHVEDYLHAAGTRPVHVSEICTELRLSRRSLHRAFHEVFGVGPVTFLRYKRLCMIRSILRESTPDQTTVSKVAIEQGFIELGRFSQYYRAMFGEYPSQTLGYAG
ncbi:MULTISPECIES: AraC family transcriptional regulator [Bradyrhizobium]|uniref:Helix-turn-helix domain-containing protein n=1 Tax=Bradyrhizobium brasilense TaxID=1419277 RepID=A0ABY8JKY4_9BRAD|nr:helix-turn-helix domain-containing protein [Bradyrhizobium brasilense]MCP1913670.1 AraC family ethanolamine operon transcriptional activator [Bradyrhizobium elkanii]OMI15340.1 AraC family transcriptional regulator [Bradyrhizobium brasilense]WFU66032.1 helix-turn-helix domain-containing protein [Bradyrhizobium brasilense]